VEAGRKDLEAAKLAARLVGEKDRETARKDLEAAKLAGEKDVLGVRLDLERRIADFMTKGDYKGVLEAIDAAKLQREAVKSQVWAKGVWGERRSSRLVGMKARRLMVAMFAFRMTGGCHGEWRRDPGRKQEERWEARHRVKRWRGASLG
jgi:hypothetical protein